MRLTTLYATALTGLAYLQGTSAQSTTSQTTYTIYKTVERVVDTTTVPYPSSLLPASSSSSSPTIYWPQTNAWHGRPSGTASAAAGTGTGLVPSYTGGGPPIASATGAAARVGIEGVGLAAVVGLVGLVVI